MRPHRLVSAIRDFFARSGEGASTLPAGFIPPVPIPAKPPSAWRAHRCLLGPYERFRLHYPRDWEAIPSESGDPVHIRPVGADLALTVSANPEPIEGPQGILCAVESLAEAHRLTLDRRSVILDRWGNDSWAGSWAWREREPDDTVRLWRLLVLGNEQGKVFALVSGEIDAVMAETVVVEGMLASLVLPPAHLLAPEFFPLALCELLNDRRSRGEELWHIGKEGHLCSGDQVVRLGNLYRAYLERENLDEIAAEVDMHQRGDVATLWANRSWDEVRDNIRVVLRREDALNDLDIVHIPLPGGLVACPVLDSNDRMTFIPCSEIDRWGVDARAILTRAVASLDADSSVGLMELIDEQTGNLQGFCIAAGDGYDSGRLLCPGLRSRLEAALGGPLLVAMPAAHSVVVLRDGHSQRQNLAAVAAQDYRRRPRPLSDALWLWTETGLVPINS